MNMEHTPSPSSTPRPGPKPGPRPGAHLAAGTQRPTPSPVPVAAPPRSNPADFGRIADDGTVYLTTAEGEREIGSWQAGTPEEGLAHYGARFDDLATEVELLEARVTAHPDEAKMISAQAEELKRSLPIAAVLGDVAALDGRLDAVLEHATTAGRQAAEEREAHRLAAIAAKEKLAEEAEQIAENSTEWKAAGDRIRAILDEWKSIHGVDRKTDDALWKRYSRARDAFNRRRGSHFAELDRTRAAARRKKEDIVERAEALQDSTEWNETARAYRDLMAEWKASGRAHREQDDRLWARFRAAQDHFFGARNALNEQRTREYQANADAKDALLAEYGPLIDPEADINKAKAKLRELQEKWEDIGYVPRNRMREFENKIAAVEQRVSEAEEAAWRRSDPEAQARVAQFEAKVADLSKQAEEAAAHGKDARAEELRAQARQWQQFAEVARQAIDS